MDDELIDTGRLSLSRRSVLPGAGFFYPDSLDDERAEERAREAIEGAEAVVVADTDADGLGCVALVRALYDAALDVADFEADIERRLTDDGDDPTDDEADAPGDEADDETDVGDDETDDHGASSVALVGASPYSIEDALQRVADYGDDGLDLYVCDLCPDRFEYVDEELAAAVDRADSVRWFDHHQWNDAVAEAVRAAGVDLVVGESDEECSTGVALRSLDFEFPPRFTELATVTRDHDLWLREDPRSDDLADYAYWADPEEYVTVVGAYGADLPDAVDDYLAERREEKEALIEAAVDRAETHEVGPWTVGVTYGRCSQNEVAEELRERGHDAAVVVKPAGSASIRGSDDFERCHEVARQVEGGGHPQAAGCKPDIYDDMLDYARHWTTDGEAAKRVILAAFDRVAEDAESGDATADESEQ
jgi:oligoribonuclease NrnB/cAMP/cGMP phosphodiesterase (DHH superfamily)